MKTIITGLAAFAALVTGCQKDDGVTSPNGNKRVIGFTSNTSKAPILDITALMNDPAGFRVYATSPASASAWYPGVDGTATYRYAGSNWGWSSGAPQWPATDAGYPMHFYAFYPINAQGFTPVATPATALKGNFVVQNSPANQTDFLAASAVASFEPANDKLSLVFDHIMSKVDFGVIAGSGMNVYVQSLTANNLKNTAVYDYMAGTWGTPSGGDTYLYYGTYNPAGSGGILPIATFSPAVADESTANPFYTSPHSKHLMLMPQTTACWNKSTTVADAYVGVIYRMSSATDPNVVGYASALSHPNFTLGSLYVGPLFAKVGFPFADGSLVWNKSMGYTYDLLLGTADATNGYYLDTFYYDENGNRTTYPVIGKSVGDPVSSGYINFTVSLTNWVDQPPVIN